MLSRIHHTRIALLAAAVVLLALASGPPARAADNIIVGSTDSPQTLDPAACYAIACANILHNIRETLVDSHSSPAKSTSRSVCSRPRSVRA